MPRVRLQRGSQALGAAGISFGHGAGKRSGTEPYPGGMENDLVNRARDVGYTAVGFGVLAFQRLQVQRRELTKELVGAAGGRAAVGRLVRQAEKVVNPVLDGVEK